MKTITIGIPAFNEARNIKKILSALLTQRGSNYSLVKIIVVSDGSTDGTDALVKSIKDKRITLHSKKSRKGKNDSINYIINKSSTDILVLLDADVLPSGNLFISKIVEEFEKNVGIVTLTPIPLPARGFIESIINSSHLLKLSLFQSLSVSNPVYLVNGRGIALSKKLYKTLLIPKKIIADDAYIAIRAMELGLKIKYSTNAKVLYRSPNTLVDHLRQSTRFYESKKQLTKIFGSDFINEKYNIPKKKVVYSAVNGLFSSPIETFSYCVLLSFSKTLSSTNTVKNSHLWTPSTSSKKL